LPKLKNFKFDFGGRTADILASKNGKEVKIEIKSSAESAFEYFGEKDLSSDYLMWVHFGTFFKSTANTKFSVFIIKSPKHYFKKPVKINLSKMRERVGRSVEELKFDIRSL